MSTLKLIKMKYFNVLYHLMYLVHKSKENVTENFKNNEGIFFNERTYTVNVLL